MSIKKELDCVQMKWDAQRKIREKYHGIPEAEARRRQWQEVLDDPILGPVVAKIKVSSRVPSSR